MKLVKEYLLEFERGNDPKEVLGIGQRHLIEKWLNDHKIKYYTINDDFTIDIHGHLDLLLPLTEKIEYLPDYIQFNYIDGYFDIGELKSTKGLPKHVNSSIFGLHRNFPNETKKLRTIMGNYNTS